MTRYNIELRVRMAMFLHCGASSSSIYRSDRGRANEVSFGSHQEQRYLKSWAGQNLGRNLEMHRPLSLFYQPNSLEEWTS